MAARKSSLPTWDLSDLYADLDDARIDKDVKSSLRKATAFQRKYKGKLPTVAKSAPKFAKAIKEYEALFQDAAKPITYASLLYAESSSDPKRGAFLQRMRKQYVQVQKQVMFFELEISSLPTATLKKLLSQKALAHFKYYLELLSKSKKYRLSEAEEALSAEKDTTGKAAFIRLFNDEFSSREYNFKHSGKLQRLSQTEMLQHLYSPKRAVRKAAAKGFSEGLKEDARRLTYIFNVLGQDKGSMDEYRGYSSAEAARHLANHIDQKVVDVMTDAITDSYKLVHDVYRLKRKKMGLKVLYDYDRYAPVTNVERKLSFKEARNVVLDAFQRFSPKMADMAKEFFDKEWIDAAKRPGKRGGAFCSFVTPDRHPYVFMNYDGNLREVFTLAHELGHALHAVLMGKTSYLYFDVPLTVAETASVFAEMLVFEYVANNTSNKDKFPLYLHKIENVFATVFRQTSMYRFEQDFHATLRAQGELETQQINELWRVRQEEMFGTSVRLTEDYDYWWSYIPHFIHTPFYVYAYAFGELLTLSLYARYKDQGSSFVEPYFDMLAAGGSKSPEKLFKPLGVNLKDESFWLEGISLITDLVNKVKKYTKSS